MMHGGRRAGAGRKPVDIDLEQVEKLCGLQCTDEDLAGFFGVNVRMIERRRRRYAFFAAAMERGRAKGRISLRRGLFLQATQGKTAALIFLAKNLPGSRDARDNEPRVANAGSDVPKVRFRGTLEDLLKLHWETLHADDPPAKDDSRVRRSGKRPPSRK
jgi:hypothetical protein